MTQPMTLNQLKVGEEMTVVAVGGEETMRRRLIELGAVTGTRIRCVMQSPLKDPCAYLIRGAVIALRRKDAAHISGILSGEALPSEARRVWD